MHCAANYVVVDAQAHILSICIYFVRFGNNRYHEAGRWPCHTDVDMRRLNCLDAVYRLFVILFLRTNIICK